MRAREFIILEVASLAAMIGNKINPQTPPNTPPPKNVNATAVPVGTQSTQGTAAPAAASAQQAPSGGTQTSQDGIAKIPPAAGIPAPSAASATSSTATTAAQPAQKYQPGQQIDLPGLGKVKVGATTSQGTEIDATNIPSIGSKIIIPSR